MPETTPTITKDVVFDALRRVKGPDLESDIVTQKLVSDPVISNGKVIVSITVPAEAASHLEPLRQAAEKVLSDLPGVERAMVALTAERRPGQGMSQNAMPQNTAPRSAPPRPQPAPQPSAPQRAPAQAPQQPQKAGVPGVKAIIAVASGKGGVGKSTTAVNLALGLKANGLEVGILDADIYGPSLPRLMGIKGRPESVSERILKPMEGYGLKVMSMGFLVEEETPMIWRGPMVMSALTQMLREVAWGELDVLVVDMPPGTGDAQLTMAQQVPLAGAVIVSTPQDLALIDARKGLNMFNKVNVPVLGIVENMSYFLCPHCGERSDIFGHGGAEHEAERIGVPFLGAVPLHMDIRETSDSGRPIVASEPQSEHARIYRHIADAVVKRLNVEKAAGVRQAPRVVVE
ncbi:iron-sulfur cluster carrier protein ApbC [Afifella aestuarii]|uniref:iron-sulfur cluster carrier protein ApbC n=1 Tax=Afifella aestuarii TaxID=1909496 RepID=UPI000FE39DC7|nr:iron-sulfur cluster carrier protein ApbC [Afifella aestuarii]